MRLEGGGCVSTHAHMIYLDNHSTTICDYRVAEVIYSTLTETYGNSSSTVHEIGDCANLAVKVATKKIARVIQASSQEIVFTSGATESITLGIKGTIRNLQNADIKPHIAIASSEHKAVLDTCQALKAQDKIKLTILSADSQAHLDLSTLEKICASDIHLLCIMAANNEVGTIYPVEKIAAIAQKHNVPFLCDATQAVGKIPIRFHDWGITMLALSAHKLYGPKGVGALVVRKGHQLEPIMYGGGQQKGLRPGTLNVPGIVGLGEACRLRQLEMVEDERAIALKRDNLQTLLLQGIPGLVINGDINNRLAGNLLISIPDVPNSAVIARVRHKLAISTGSACTSGVEEPSHVLTAMGLAENVIEGSLRLGLGKFTTDEEVATAAEILISEIKSIRELL